MKREEVECCEELLVHDQKVQEVLKEMPSEETLKELADFYKVFGDATRVKILFVLLQAEMCVCDLAETLGMTQSAISHQLRVSVSYTHLIIVCGIFVWYFSKKLTNPIRELSLIHI